ncbi:hypothetical protein PT2222_60302 [Paraburkholderia tropica]
MMRASGWKRRCTRRGARRCGRGVHRERERCRDVHRIKGAMHRDGDAGGAETCLAAASA